MPRLNAILETSLYVADLERAVAFYRRVLELPLLDRDDRFAAFDVPGRQVLLLFVRGGTTRPIALRGGTIPPHDGDGPLHVAFSVDAGEMGAWEEHLGRENVPIESRVTWSDRDRSLYFRDPDGHLVELATPGLWWR